MTRRDKIVFLLDNLADLVGPSLSAHGPGGGDGPGFPLSTSMADHPSVVELLYRLAQLRTTAPKHAQHLEAWYGCEYAVDAQAKTIRRRGKTVTVRHPDGTPVMEYRRYRPIPAWMRQVPLCHEPRCECRGLLPRTVCRGVAFVDVMFAGEPFIPRQLEEVAFGRRLKEPAGGQPLTIVYRSPGHEAEAVVRLRRGGSRENTLHIRNI